MDTSVTVGWAAGRPQPDGTPAPSKAATWDRPLHTTEYVERLSFTGRGSDYFRIWVVNTLFTLLTLGIYSAWAKQRKARWFARHTLLLGDPFDYHGQPWRILAGRALALGLLVAYTHAFDWSAWAGLAMLGLLYLCGPALFAGAQRFKLGNTSWRGLRFGFDAPVATVYLNCLPLLVMWTWSSAAAGLGMDEAVLGLLALAVAPLFPWAHAWLKRLQHRHARYGSAHFSYDGPVLAFYGLYLRLSMVGLLGGILAAVGGWLLGRWLNHGAGWLQPLTLLSPVAAMLVIWLTIWPFYAAQLQRIVWSASRLEHLGFRFELDGTRLWQNTLGQCLLVLLTLGLYWPFAAVHLARLRIEAMHLVSDRPPQGWVMQSHAAGDARGAAGDGAADAFGLDLGW